MKLQDTRYKYQTKLKDQGTITKTEREKEGYTLTLILSSTQGVPAIPSRLRASQGMGEAN
jgi:hypothetical protein